MKPAKFPNRNWTKSGPVYVYWLELNPLTNTRSWRELSIQKPPLKGEISISDKIYELMYLKIAVFLKNIKLQFLSFTSYCKMLKGYVSKYSYEKYESWSFWCYRWRYTKTTYD